MVKTVGASIPNLGIGASVNNKMENKQREGVTSTSGVTPFEANLEREAQPSTVTAKNRTTPASKTKDEPKNAGRNQAKTTTKSAPTKEKGAAVATREAEDETTEVELKDTKVATKARTGAHKKLTNANISAKQELQSENASESLPNARIAAKTKIQKVDEGTRAGATAGAEKVQPPSQISAEGAVVKTASTSNEIAPQATTASAAVMTITPRSISPAEQKQEIMTMFVDDMQNAFGVRPEELVQAMTSLSEEELGRTPESTMNLVLNQLNIQNGERKLAEHLYGEMLNATAAVDAQAQQIQVTPPVLDMQVMSQKEVRQQNLTKGLAELNKNFFEVQTKEVQPYQQNAALIQKSKNSKQEQESDTPMSGTELAAIGGGLTFAGGLATVNQTQTSMPSQTAMSNPAVVNNAGPFSQKTQNGLPEKVVQLSQNTERAEINSMEALPSEFVTYDNAVTGSTAFADSLSEIALPADILPTYGPMGLETQTAANIPNEANSIVGLSTGSSLGFSAYGSNGDSEAKSDSDKRRSFTADSTAEAKEILNSELKQSENGQRPTDVSNQKSEMRADSPAAPTVVTNSSDARSERIENMRQILNRAEILATNGGGEIRVQLNPANLGQVQLMVKVDDGRVNVQMVTESEQAKRMIEGGMRDLRAELNDSNLHLEGLQVDVSKSASTELRQNLDSQNQSAQEQARNMAQDFARGFLGQNRDERMWQREQFLADPMARPAGSNYAKSRIEDRAVDATSKSQGTSGTAKRLNVVA